MYSKHIRRVIGFVVGLALFVGATSFASAAGGTGAPQVTIPAALAGMQYPGSALTLPDWSDDPMVNAQIGIPDWLARVQYPGTSSQPTVVLTQTDRGSTDGTFDWGSAGVGAGFVAGLGLLGAGSLLVVRRRRPLAQV